MGVLLRVALTVLLASGVTAFDVAPVQAISRVLILTPLQTDVLEGDPVTFRGRAVGSEPGAVVALQRLVAGDWSRVDRLRLGHRDRFRFTTVPPRGRQRYRVRMVKQVGQRLLPSTAQTVRVYWRPDLSSVTATHDVDEATGDVDAEAGGSVAAVPDGTELTREHLQGTWWVPVQTTTITDHRWNDHFTTPYGTEYRYTLSASGLRLAASSPSLQALSKAQLPVDATTSVAFPTEQRHLSVVLEVDQTYTYSGPYWVSPRLTDPAGEPVPGFGGSSDVITFRAPMSGTYALDLGGNPAEEQPARITLSRPVEVATTLDATLDVASGLPSQLVDVTFEGEPGSYISQNEIRVWWRSERDDARLIAPNGQVVPLLATLPDRTRLWHLPDLAGTYTLRIIPAYLTVDAPGFTLLSVVERAMPLNAEATTVDFDRRGRVAVLGTPTPAGADVSFAAAPWRAHVLMAPDGTEDDGWPSVSPTQEGRYRMLVSASEAGRIDFFASTAEWFDVSLDGSPVPFDFGPSVGRNAVLRIPVADGDVFSVNAHYADGSRCGSISTFHPTSSLATGRQSQSAYPLVVFAKEAGTVVVRLQPCQQEGWFSARRITPVTMERLESSSAYQARATFAQPGDVAMLLLDAPVTGRSYTFSIAGSKLTNADAVTFGGESFLGSFDRPTERLSGLQTLIFWGGPRATGWVDINARPW